MKLNILIGGKAGQGINKVSEIVAKTLIKQGYFVFNYRDYPSIIMGGHNFNVLCISDKPVQSHESKYDCIVALDSNTLKTHKKELKKGGLVIDYKPFESFRRNLNIALAGALIKALSLEKKDLLLEIKKGLKNKPGLKESLEAAKQGFQSLEIKFKLKKLPAKKIAYISGSQAVAIGAKNSKINFYCAYPMTPATNVLHEIANLKNKNLVVYQPEGEIAAINAALGASFAGAKAMVGTSGGGFDLMAEGLSLAGATELPIVVYLASRVGPATGIPTYTMQADLEIALRSGHGEFPRIVIAPGDPKETIEKVNEAFYLANKYNCLVIIISDKHLAESDFSMHESPRKALSVKLNRGLPGNQTVRANSYEEDPYGVTTEESQIAIKNAEARLKQYKAIKKACLNLETFKIYGKKTSKNLIIGWGSTKNAIIDAINGLDYKFIQPIYIKPFPDKLKTELNKAEKLILIENNLTGQLGRLIREATGIKIANRILKYDGRPFLADELRKKLT